MFQRQRDDALATCRKLEDRCKQFEQERNHAQNVCEKLAQAMVMIKELNNTGHYVDYDGESINKGCSASDVAKKALDEYRKMKEEL